MNNPRSEQTTANTSSSSKPGAPKNPALACILSLVCVGAGQLYVDNPGKAVTLFGAAVVCGVLFGPAGFVLILPLAGYAAYDAYQLATHYNEMLIAAESKAREQTLAQQKYEAATVSVEDFVERIDKAYLLAKNELLDQNEFLQRKAQIIDVLEVKSPREGVDDFLTALVPLMKSKALTSEEIVKIKKLLI
ncbi:hypothetical protein [Bordetella ansorpii]|uniref:hypothetical protein n=1 Tax=Bordetella ansorpii TaxID=288768 RepID=UPI0012E946D3|nr:hypothetical protein [Bordetella ansorpii]